MDLVNETTQGSPSIQEARISTQSLPALSSPPRLSSTKQSSVSNSETEKACRICHVSSGTGGHGSELIELGCGCKNGLELAHQHCAEAWFKIKGNRYCEICGSDAKNIKRFGSCESIDIWHDDRRDVTIQIEQISVYERRKRFWICSFFIFLFLFAFIVPLFFRLIVF